MAWRPVERRGPVVPMCGVMVGCDDSEDEPSRRADHPVALALTPREPAFVAATESSDRVDRRVRNVEQSVWLL